LINFITATITQVNQLTLNSGKFETHNCLAKNHHHKTKLTKPEKKRRVKNKSFALRINLYF